MSQDEPECLPQIPRRAFVRSLALAGALTPILASGGATRMGDPILEEKIRRARLSGPSVVTADATVAEMASNGQMTILARGTNQWVCCPGNENVVGDVPMALDPMGMQWFRDLHAHRPKPTNTAPGLIYMLCGAIQHSYTIRSIGRALPSRLARIG
jgi:hypothetical protein